MEVSKVMNWSVHEAKGARLVDERYRRVLSDILGAKLASADMSFSKACGNSLRQAAGRLVRHDEMEPDDLLAGHYEATLERCMGESTIVVAQDSTSYSYSTHTATTGLGPLNDSKVAFGIHQHAALAMTEDKLPLGVLHAKFWVRPEEGRSRDKRHETPFEEKESFKWCETADRVGELCAPYLEGGGRVVLTGDRESDVFELLARLRPSGMELLIRACQPRNVELQISRRTCSLLEATDYVAPLGQYDLNVPARPMHTGKPAQAARVAKMELRAAYVMVQPPRNGTARAMKPVPAWVVTTKELVPEEATHEPLNWTLITTMDASNADAALRIVNLYSCRWQIEQLHFTLKSGCQAEKLQMDDAATLCNTLALYIIIAWRLMFMTHVARIAPETPASLIVDETELAVLKQLTGKPVTTAAEVIIAIARSVGFEPYKNGPPPGVKTIWLGLRKLEAMAEGWKLALAFTRLEKM
jgi:hypothetical protein